LVGEMEEDGLVRYGANPHHRRAKLVLLTERGQAAFRAAMNRQRPWAAALSRGLSSEAIQAATAVLRTLLRRLDGPAAELRGLHDHHQTEGDSHAIARRNG
jgi:DNA-binding MarR family transcriptional regulator